jgi:ubiquinone/menaquinone biosynthesis C-methylase UbiE
MRHSHSHQTRTDFSTITEVSGEPVSQAQIKRLIQRYVWAAEQSSGCDVLDVACGTGPGLGLISAKGRTVIGADIDEQALKRAKQHYGERIALLECDAQKLPFSDRSFDVISIFEALYYLPNADKFFAECRRVLRPGGKLLISTANKNLYDFNPSPYSTAYLNAPELVVRLAQYGFTSTFFVGEAASDSRVVTKLVRLFRFLAVRFRIIPGSMRGKRLLRRLIFGELRPLPSELTGAEASYEAPSMISATTPNRTHRILYCFAELRNPSFEAEVS